MPGVDVDVYKFNQWNHRSSDGSPTPSQRPGVAAAVTQPNDPYVPGIAQVQGQRCQCTEAVAQPHDRYMPGI